MVKDTRARSPESMQQVLANQQVTLVFTTHSHTDTGSYRAVRVSECASVCVRVRVVNSQALKPHVVHTQRWQRHNTT